jgi:FlaA1/EpsC-like NDP-sugar epimerase
MQVTTRLCRQYACVRNRHLLGWDVVTQPLIVLLAFAVRTDAAVPPAYVQPALLYGALLLVLRPLLFLQAGLYRQMWHYASLREARLLLVASSVATIVSALLFYGLLMPLRLVAAAPRSIPIIEGGLALAVAAAPRLLLRLATRRVSLAAKRAGGGARAERTARQPATPL